MNIIGWIVIISFIVYVINSSLQRRELVDTVKEELSRIKYELESIKRSVNNVERSNKCH